MHPILFRIPLPKAQVPALYFYLAVMALGALYAAWQLFVRKDKKGSIPGVILIVVALGAKLANVIEKIGGSTDGMVELSPIPIYSYGVMLGLSLVVGWYLTLTLAEKDGLPKETMANNYVVTAIAAIAGSRILYVLTNLNEFNSPIDIFALRRGGLVAYGGFLGGFLGSYFYLRRYKISLLPWADVAVPSLAAGLMITRIGCYLFGCDFGRPLAENDPAWLRSLGTFPRWMPGLLHEGNGSEGSPAWAQHVKQHLINDSATTSLAVHPTQLYESIVGACLLALMLLSRRKQKFRGQIFLLFTFAYGVCRYMLEILRDDDERGSLPFSAGKHVMIPLGLALFAVGFAIGFSKLIKNTTTLRVVQALAFVPAIVMYFVMAPASYGESTNYQWSTSQFVAIITGVGACIAFSVLYKAALAHPESAMRIPTPAVVGGAPAAVADDEDDEDDADDDEDEAPPPPKKVVASKKVAAKVSKRAPAKKVAEPAKKKAAAADDDDEDDDADEKKSAADDEDDDADEKASASAKPDDDAADKKKSASAKADDDAEKDAAEKADDEEA